jgi:hypothetical protein
MKILRQQIIVSLLPIHQHETVSTNGYSYNVMECHVLSLRSYNFTAIWRLR